MSKFKLHWLDGRTEILTGDSIKDAFTGAGYGEGALRALDSFEIISDSFKVAETAMMNISMNATSSKIILDNAIVLSKDQYNSMQQRILDLEKENGEIDQLASAGFEMLGVAIKIANDNRFVFGGIFVEKARTYVDKFKTLHKKRLPLIED
jgi:hypothetical protein